MSAGAGGGGRNDQFRSLYKKYYRRVLSFFIRAFRLSHEDAEELTQETFLRFFEAMDEYRGEAEWAFLETTARNIALNKIRWWGAARRHGVTVPIDDPAMREPAAPQEIEYADREMEALHRKRLHDAIATLAPRQRQCTQLWLEDFKLHEIASTLRISLDAVKAALRDGKKQLIAKLGDGAGLPEDEQ